jgi:hypothetical protein
LISEQKLFQDDSITFLKIKNKVNSISNFKHEVKFQIFDEVIHMMSKKTALMKSWLKGWNSYKNSS